MVKRVFITSDLGQPMPKWISWLKAIVDGMSTHHHEHAHRLTYLFVCPADDLPLNVSRETLQSNRFLRQIPNILVKRFINLVEKMSKDENQDKFRKFMKVYGSVIKLGAVESPNEQQKLAGLARWDTNLRNFTSLDQVSRLFCTLPSPILILDGVFSMSKIGKRVRLRSSSWLESARPRKSWPSLCLWRSFKHA
jgi:heat shock protein beta